MNENRRPIVTGSDWMRNVERRLLSQERRPVHASAAALLGPGIASQAVLISDWNNEVIGYNGFFYSQPGAINSPDSTMHWIGSSVVDADGAGIQQVVSYVTGTIGSGLTTPYLGTTWSRSFLSPPGQTPVFNGWAVLTPFQQVVSAGDVTVTTVTPVTVGLAWSTTVRSSHETYQVSSSLGLLHNGTNASTFVAELVVDGVIQGPAIRWNPQGVANAVDTASQTWLVSGLSVGIRDFHMTGRVNSTPESYTVRGGDSTISVLRTT